MTSATCLEQTPEVSADVSEHAEVEVVETCMLQIGKVELYHLLRLVLIELKSPQLSLSYRHRLHLLAENMKALAGDNGDFDDLWEGNMGEDAAASLLLRS